MTEYELIGERLKIARLCAGLTQEQLGKHVFMNKSTIQRYETGKIKNVKIPVLHCLAKALKVDPNWLGGKANGFNTNFYQTGIKNKEDKTMHTYVLLREPESSNLMYDPEILIIDADESYVGRAKVRSLMEAGYVKVGEIRDTLLKPRQIKNGIAKRYIMDRDKKRTAINVVHNMLLEHLG